MFTHMNDDVEKDMKFEEAPSQEKKVIIWKSATYDSSDQKCAVSRIYSQHTHRLFFYSPILNCKDPKIARAKYKSDGIKFIAPLKYKSEDGNAVELIAKLNNVYAEKEVSSSGDTLLVFKHTPRGF